MKLNVKFTENAKRFRSRFSETTVITIEKGVDYYDGEYEVIPTVESQSLPTAKKTMKEDLTVCAIPVFNVSNDTGGSTFYIATMEEALEGGGLIKK